MPRTTRMVTVHYRRLARPDTGLLPGQSLADAVGQVLLSNQYAPNWQSRVTHAPDSPNIRRFVNNSHVDIGSTFGDLCSFTRDEMQAVIDTGQVSTPSVNVDDIKAPSGRDYLHGMAYWLLVGDHCYVIQHTAVRAPALASYFSWLLRQMNVLQPNQQITLQDKFEADDQTADVGDVTGIEIGGIVPDLPETVHSDPLIDSRSIEVRRTLEERVPSLPAGLSWLESLVGPTEVGRILSRVPDGAALKVTLQVGYIALKRGLSRRPMDDLAVAARNFDHGAVRIRGRKGRISGNETQIHTSVQVKLVRENGHLLDFQDAHEQLENVHARFLEEGRITPE